MIARLFLLAGLALASPALAASDISLPPRRCCSSRTTWRA